MYLLFRHHHIRPSEFYQMGFYERIVTRAFMHYQVEKTNEEMEKIKM